MSVAHFLRNPALGLWFAGLLFLLAGLPAAADIPDEARIREMELAMDRAEKALVSDDRAQISQQRGVIDDLIGRALEFRSEIGGQSKRVFGQLETLGVGEEGQDTAESAEIAKKRKEISAQHAELVNAEKRLGLLVVRGEQLLAEISRKSRQRLKSSLFDYRGSGLDAESWRQAWADYHEFLPKSLIDMPVGWWRAMRETGEERFLFAWAGGILLLSLLIGWPARNWILARFGTANLAEAASLPRKLAAGVMEGVGLGTVPVIFIAALGLYLDFGVDLGGDFRIVVRALSRFALLYLIAYCLLHAVFLRGAASGELLGMESGIAHILFRRLFLTLTLFVSFEVFHAVMGWASLSVGAESVHALVYALVMAPVLLSLLDRRFWNLGGAGSEAGAEEATGEEALPAPKPLIFRLRPLLALLFLMPLASALYDYPKLSGFLMRAIVLSLVLFGAYWLVRRILREALTALGDPKSRANAAFSRFWGADGARVARGSFWIGLLAECVLFLFALVLGLALWGWGTDESISWIGKLFRGVPLGSFTFSLQDFLVALALFAGIVLATRLLQTLLDRHILPNLTQDFGVRDSLRTATGYVGIVVAAVIGISALGLDLSNLALIAGALTVGLGFGLQNIVNNFVSGLILLAERPIKPGDWVLIGGNEGTVKKVNVRSTEIETFQKASVILPNADLIANPVINWTHKNVQGRTEVAVGVAYGTDVDKVEAILLECAREHPNVLVRPEPFVLFMNFGESSLDFELRAYVRNVEKRFHTASDLRKAIARRFAAENIEIPFPQRVVHLPPDKA